MHFDLFNGDADGLCALVQLRQAEPKDSTLITGVKRDLALVSRVPVLKSDKPEVVKKATEKSDAILLDIHLAEIRALVSRTQVDVAQALGVKQPTVAGMERSGKDLRLSSLKRYVEALGGKVSIDIELPDGQHRSFRI